MALISPIWDYYTIVVSAPMKLPSNDYHWTLLMISQHWFRELFGSIRQQTITQTSVIAILRHYTTMSEVTVILSMANQLNLQCFLDKTANPFHVGLLYDFRNSVTYWQWVMMTTFQARFLVMNKRDVGANRMTSWHWNAFCITDLLWGESTGDRRILITTDQ